MVTIDNALGAQRQQVTIPTDSVDVLFLVVTLVSLGQVAKRQDDDYERQPLCLKKIGLRGGPHLQRGTVYRRRH